MCEGRLSGGGEGDGAAALSLSLSLRVRPQALPPSDPLFHCSGASSAVQVRRSNCTIPH